MSRPMRQPDHIPALGARILGPEDEPPRRRRLRIQLLLTVMLLTTNAIAVAIAAAMITAVVPGPTVFVPALRLENFVLVPVYVLVAFVIGLVWITRMALRDLRWAILDRPPERGDLRATLSLPWRMTGVQAALWAIATVLFTLLYGRSDPILYFMVGFTLVFAGTISCTLGYLFAEFSLRPAAAQALAASSSIPRSRTGVTARIVLSWMIGSGIPVAGTMIIAVFGLTYGDYTAADMAVPMLALGGTTLLVGLLTTRLIAAATLAPVRTVRAAMATVETGDLDADVVVFDGTELGDLQSGFNRMAAGLREREHIRDLFGRHVGTEVAQAAMDSDVELGGSVVEVAVLFVDIIGSTAMAMEASPTEVVEVLNRFFAVVVDEIHAHGGTVDKFQGDAALAVFGALRPLDDPAGAALATARTMHARLTAEVPQIRAGIGISAGPAVAGNIGAHSRYEYTVIGDPVNEAARLSERAKEHPLPVLASGSVYARAQAAEQRRWTDVGAVELRGRGVPTVLLTPVESTLPSSAGQQSFISSQTTPEQA